MGKHPMLFVVYARADTARVRPVVQLLRNAGIDVWFDIDRLRPGSSFTDEILQAIRASAGALVFVSAALAASHHAPREIEALAAEGKAIISIELDHVQLPAHMECFLSRLQWIDLATPDSPSLNRAADLTRAFLSQISHARPASPANSTAKLEEHAATTLAQTARRAVPTGPPNGVPTSVFIVHGHEDRLLEEVEAHLNTVGVRSVVLRRIGGPSQSLFQKFMQWGTDTRFALVLLSADDMGASRIQYDAAGVGPNALQFRARQNVILELGFFYGHLGWENVFVLYKRPDRVFPNFERPSDLDGVVFDIVDDSGEWKEHLDRTLRKAGFVLKGLASMDNA